MNLKIISDTVLAYNSLINDPSFYNTCLSTYARQEISIIRHHITHAGLKVYVRNNVIDKGTIIGFFIMFDEVRFSVVDKKNLYHASWKDLTLYEY